MNASPGCTPEAAAAFFGPGRALFWAQAPGRLDLFGGIADYSGSLVLQLPLAKSTVVGVAWRDDRLVRARSVELGDFSLALESLLDEAGDPRSPEQVQRLLAREPSHAWAAYVVGSLLLLAHVKGLKLTRGVDLLVASEVPIGKGLASSASLEVAALRALSQAAAIDLDGEGGVELAALAQRVENEVVGAPCGIMDQVAIQRGRPGTLLPIICRPCEVLEPVPLPPELRVFAVDSGVRHAVGSASYTDVRTAAYMGYSLIAGACGTPAQALSRARETGDRSSLPFGGYLANVAPSLFEERFSRLLPEQMTGHEFLAAGYPSIDRATAVEEDRTYRVRAAAAHPVFENFRIELALRLLRSLAAGEPSCPGSRERVYRHLGEILFQAHASYTACGLGHDATDRIARLARELGPESGVYGARVTGGGAGGTVCLLCRADLEPEALKSQLAGTPFALLDL
ncbi:MAG: GHMP kinase [Planctomycetota bacterium]